LKLSVITVVFNNVRYIEDCIKSVISQTHPDTEYIIVDGKSTDGTLEIINRYRDRISKIISEKDSGYAYAMNKGLAAATGDAVGFLHSDDIYASDAVLEKIATALARNSVDSVYGDLLYVKKENPEKIIRCWKSGECSIAKLKRGWMPPHPTFFAKKEIYKKYGLFNTDFKIAADYELMLRFLYKYRISTFHIGDILVKMRWGGASNRNVKNLIRKTAEDYKIARMYDLGIPTIAMKNLAKLPQFFTRSR
jgi:glycosyltransferase